MKKFISIFKKVGGVNILIQYFRAHILFYVIVQILCQGFSKKSLEIVRLSIEKKILSKLRRKNKQFISDYISNESELATLEKKERSNKVWVCWLQGMEQAPKLVKSCYESLKENLYEKEIIMITEDNYRDYVEFPKFIQQKIDDNIITKTHMSDLLRLELLLNYGGTWIDATVFCSGNNIPNYMLDSDLFVFQCLKPGYDGHSVSISSWLMTACTNHPILKLTRALLYNYWETNDNMIDYFLLHNFFQLAIETYPEEWNKVIPFSSATPHILLLRLFEQYDDCVWNAVKNMTPFHKLTYKFEEEQINITKTYFDVIFNSKDLS